jgi:hypothetical protein
MRKKNKWHVYSSISPPLHSPYKNDEKNETGTITTD